MYLREQAETVKVSPEKRKTVSVRQQRCACQDVRTLQRTKNDFSRDGGNSLPESSASPRLGVVQRAIIFQGVKLKEGDSESIYREFKESGLLKQARKKQGLNLGKEGCIRYLEEMIQTPEAIVAHSYEDLIWELQWYISCSRSESTEGKEEDGLNFGSPLLASLVPFTLLDLITDYSERSMNSKQMDELSDESSDVEFDEAFDEPDDMQDLYRPSSPIVTGDEILSKSRRKKNLKISFGEERERSTIFRGNFMAGVSSYERMMEDESCVSELVAMFRGIIKHSENKMVNDLYDLIIAMEGCARTTHNMALAYIFFNNYEEIKVAHGGKETLFELAEKYLTFVKKGGAADSKACIENPYEIQMLMAHCHANGIPLTVEAISAHLVAMVEELIENAHISMELKSGKKKK